MGQSLLNRNMKKMATFDVLYWGKIDVRQSIAQACQSIKFNKMTVLYLIHQDGHWTSADRRGHVILLNWRTFIF